MSEHSAKILPALEGRVFPPLRSQADPARLIARQIDFADDRKMQLEILSQTGDILASGNIETVKIDPPLGSAPRRITFADGTLFETDDHAGVEEISGRTHGALLHHWEQLHPRLIAVLVATVGAGWLLWRYGLDIMVSAAIALTPPAIIEQIDKGTLQSIDFMMAEETLLSKAEQKRVAKIFHKMLGVLEIDERADANFQILFRNMPEIGPNAFALPGGTVVMTDQFVEQFGQDDVLAGVLGHEIGHVVEKHGLRQIYRSLSIYLLVAFMAGDTGPLIEDILLEGNLLLSLSYSRGHETAADEFGLGLSHEAGFDPAGLKIFFEEMSELMGDPPAWMSTHPASGERVKAIDAYIQTLE